MLRFDVYGLIRTYVCMYMENLLLRDVPWLSESENSKPLVGLTWMHTNHRRIVRWKDLIVDMILGENIPIRAPQPLI